MVRLESRDAFGDDPVRGVVAMKMRFLSKCTLRVRALMCCTKSNVMIEFQGLEVLILNEECCQDQKGG